MEVLKKGRERDMGRELTCNMCASLLLVLPIDVETRTSKDYSGSTDTYYYVTCPECKHENLVSYKYTSLR